MGFGRRRAWAAALVVGVALLVWIAWRGDQPENSLFVPSGVVVVDVPTCDSPGHCSRVELPAELYPDRPTPPTVGLLPVPDHNQPPIEGGDDPPADTPEIWVRSEVDPLIRFEVRLPSWLRAPEGDSAELQFAVVVERVGPVVMVDSVATQVELAGDCVHATEAVIPPRSGAPPPVVVVPLTISAWRQAEASDITC